MRTTIRLDDDVLRVVKRYAKNRSVALGKAVTELVRRGLTRPTPRRVVNGLQVFDLPPGSPKITSKRVRELEDEE